MVQAKIDLKKAIAASEVSTADFLGWTTPVVEEIERDTYKNRDCGTSVELESAWFTYK